VGASRKTSNSSETKFAEIAACRPWLEAELRIVKPKLVVAMGATAAQTIFGPSFRVTRERGKVYRRSLRQESLRLFIRRRSFGNPMRRRASASISFLSLIFAPRYALLAKNKGSLDRRCVSRFVLCNECLAKLIKRSLFYFSARPLH